MYSWVKESDVWNPHSDCDTKEIMVFQFAKNRVVTDVVFGNMMERLTQVFGNFYLCEEDYRSSNFMLCHAMNIISCCYYYF